ncbi:hypothetical protein ACSVBT_12740 [Afipia sp. TerB]
MPLHPEEDFTPASIIAVSPPALAYAREFAHAIGIVRGGSQIVAFEWATSVEMKEGPDHPPIDLGACLVLGAYRRAEVPDEALRLIDGFEFAVKIPASVRAESIEQLIDTNDVKPFRLTLR